MKAALIIATVAVVLVGVELLSGGSNGTAPGKPAPPLPAEVLIPPRVTVASLRGKPAAINFWASWCGPCRQEAPALERLARSLRGRATLVGIDWNDGLSGARSFIDQHGWTFPNLRDANGTVGDRYEISGLPTTFVINSQGLITEVLRGPQDVSSVKQALRSAH